MGYIGPYVAKLVLCALAGVSPADATVSATTVSVSPAEFEGRLADPARDRITQGVLDGIERAGASVVDAEATYILRTRVVVEDRSYRMRVALFDVQTEAELAYDEVGCEICGSGEAADLLTDSAARLLARVHKSEASLTFLVVRTTPPGAMVTVDGRSAGSTPLKFAVTPGVHRVTAQIRGYEPAERVVESARGTQEVVAMEMARSRRRSFTVAGAVTLGFGAAATVAGSALIGINGRPHQPSCTAQNQDINGTCPQQYRSLAAGTVLTSIGVAAIVTGAVLLARRFGKRAPGRRASIRRFKFGFAGAKG